MFMKLFTKGGEIEGDFEYLLERARMGDKILLYEGEYDNWEIHPDGIVIRIGHRLLVNGKTLISRRSLKVTPWKFTGGLVQEAHKQIYFNGHLLVFGGKWNEWLPHPYGVVIRERNRFFLVVSKPED